MKMNLHTHTPRCHHAIGSEREYIERAIAAGLDTLGFSDHAPMPFEGDYYSTYRMALSDTRGYVDALLKLREEYRGKIDILIGFEAEYYPAVFPRLLEFISEYPIDYLLLGQHFLGNEQNAPYACRRTKDESFFAAYVDQVCEGIRTGAFTYLAHPDLYMRSYPEFDRDCREAAKDLCREVREMGLLVEYNLEGVRASQNEGRVLYPHPAFWETAAGEDVRAIIGVDAHSPQSLEKTVLWQQSYDLLRGMGFEIVTSLSL